MAAILVVDDERKQADILRTILAAHDHDVDTAANGREARAKIDAGAYDIVLTDLLMPGEDGLALLKYVAGDFPRLGAIVMTAHGSFESAVAAMQQGALDYLQKPFGTEELLLTLERALARLNLVRENRRLQRELTTRFRVENIVGSHGSMQEVLRLIHKVAPSNATVLIRGESGTGKELVARAIHHLSPRGAGPFYPLNCSAIPETLIESELFGYERGAFTGARQRKVGLFELADSGTLFLDEIGDLSAAMQAKVLRVLQEKAFRRVGGEKEIHVDTRILAATNKDLEAAMARGDFREDLYYRLNVVSFVLPPLRERRTDIPELASHFLRQASARTGKTVTESTAEALDILLAYDWPGNVRQLASVIERAVLLCDGERLTPEDLPLDVRTRAFARPPVALPESGLSLEALERDLIRQALTKAGGVIARAAPLLGLSYYALYHRVQKLAEQDPTIRTLIRGKEGAEPAEKRPA